MRRLFGTTTFFVAFIGVVCASALGLAQGSGPEDASPSGVSPEQALCQRVEEGRKAWLANVELFGNYTYVRARFLSEEEALNEDSSEGTVVLAARGLIAKKGETYRFRIAYGDPPNTLDGDESALRVIDQAANKKFEIFIRPEAENPGQVYGSLATRQKDATGPGVDGLVNMNTPFVFLSTLYTRRYGASILTEQSQWKRSTTDTSS